jgi:hypothetical protein
MNINVKGMKIDAVSALAGMGLGLGLGALMGVLLTRRTYEQRLTSEIDSVKEHYRTRSEAAMRRHQDRQQASGLVGQAAPVERGPASGPERRVVHLSDAEFYSPEHEGAEPSKIAPDGDPMDGYPEDDDEDDDDEEAGYPPDDEPERLGPGPYVISRAEFFDTETRGSDYRKLTITWYEGDKVLADDGGIPVPDFGSVIGPDFMQRFGDNSDDPTVVYIRNNKLEVDYEVVKDDRNYTEAVLGYGRP